MFALAPYLYTHVSDKDIILNMKISESSLFGGVGISF